MQDVSGVEAPVATKDIPVDAIYPCPGILNPFKPRLFYLNPGAGDVLNFT